MGSKKVRKYWDQVSDHDDFEATRANPDIIATPDPIEDLADKSLLYQSVRNLKEPYKGLIINHLGLFGREPTSLRHLATTNGMTKDKMFRLYKKAQKRLRVEFFRLLNGGKVNEVS